MNRNCSKKNTVGVLHPTAPSFLVSTPVMVRVLKRVNRKRYAEAKQLRVPAQDASGYFDMAVVGIRRTVRIRNMEDAGWYVEKICFENPKSQKNFLAAFFTELASYKYATVFVCVAMLARLSLLATVPTKAYFTSDAAASGITFSAGTLSIEVSPLPENPVPELVPGTEGLMQIDIHNTGSIETQYKISTAITEDPSLPLCHGVVVQATDGVNNATGTLESFNVSPLFFSGNVAQWNFTFSLLDGAEGTLSEASCHFKWIITAWQSSMPDPSQGFSDSKEISSVVTSGVWPVLVESFVGNVEPEDVSPDNDNPDNDNLEQQDSPQVGEESEDPPLNPQPEVPQEDPVKNVSDSQEVTE
jgi:hypothetical protein